MKQAHSIHSRCGDLGMTIVLVMFRQYIFGGFLDTNWGGTFQIHVIVCFLFPLLLDTRDEVTAPKRGFVSNNDLRHSFGPKIYKHLKLILNCLLWFHPKMTYSLVLKIINHKIILNRFSFLFFFNKLLEIIMYNQLMAFLEKNEVICPGLFGYHNQYLISHTISLINSNGNSGSLFNFAILINQFALLSVLNQLLYVSPGVLGFLEIGRASCRERVQISVVAVSLKKKKKKITQK